MFGSTVNPHLAAESASFGAWQAAASAAGSLTVSARQTPDDGDSLGAMFQRAHAFARLGQHEQAREICAEAILQFQPLLVASRPKLRAAFAALIVARGFKLLARLARAASGQTIRVAVSDGTSSGPPFCRQQDARGVVTYTVDGGYLASLSAEHGFVKRWSAELASGAADEDDRDVGIGFGRDMFPAFA